MTRRQVPASWIVAGVSLWIASIGNAALWRRLDSLGTFDNPAGWLFALAVLAMVWASVCALLSCMAWPRILKPLACVVLLTSAFAGHFMLSYGVVMDPGMLANAVQTDAHEVRGLFSGALLTTVAAIAILPMMVLLPQPVAYGPLRKRAAHNVFWTLGTLLLLFAMLLASFQPLAALMRNHKDIRYLINPLASFYSLARVAHKPWQDVAGKLATIGADAHMADAAGASRPAILLLVLGETARSDHFSLNGYERDTTPLLARQGVTSFRNAWACGTSTATSVPCMFSGLSREGFAARKGAHEGLLDVLQHAGLAVLWIDNQSGCKGVCDRVPHESTTATRGSARCATGECLDAVMLEHLDERIATLEPQRTRRGIVVVLHQMGSHGPAYHLRSPPDAKRFAPECRTAALNDCSRDAVVNAYDNSILYTDRFLSQAIDWLKSREAAADTAMLYVSDHGESLGENNLYLHGLPYLIAPDVQKHVPWITWASEGFQRSRQLSMNCLQTARDARISHEHYFHSILGLMNVRTEAYRLKLDAYAPCRVLQAPDILSDWEQGARIHETLRCPRNPGPAAVCRTGARDRASRARSGGRGRAEPRAAVPSAGRRRHRLEHARRRGRPRDPQVRHGAATERGFLAGHGPGLGQRLRRPHRRALVRARRP